MSTILERITEFRRSVVTNVFDHKLRDQSEDSLDVSRREVTKEKKAAAAPKKDKLSLRDQWAVAKVELALEFAQQGNKRFIEEMTRVRSIKRKKKTSKGTKRGRSKVKATRPTNTRTEAGRDVA